MNYIRLDGLPQVMFAHTFEIEDYQNVLPAVENYMEICYIDEGDLTVHKGNETYIASAGDILLNMFRQSLSLESRGKHRHHTVCFRLPFALCTDKQPHTIAVPFITKSKPETAKLRNMIDEIIRIHTLSPNQTLLCASIFFEILSCLHECNLQRNKPDAYSNLLYINNAKNYIYENLNRHIQQREIAEHLKISPQYLCSIFKRIEGIPLMTYINKTKLGKIKELMEKHNFKLYQAAELFGYSDPNYVSTLYKRYFHVNITDPHKKMQRKEDL